MIKFKNLKRFALATALSAVGFVAGQVVSDAANGNVYFTKDSNTNAGTIDFEEATLYFKNNGHTAVRYSFDQGKSWVTLRGLATGDVDVAIDISSLAASKDTYVTIQGLDGGTATNVASPSSMTIKKELKIAGFKLTYNAPKGEVTFVKGPAGSYQYRTAATAKWNNFASALTADAVVSNSAISKLQAKGGTFFVRAAALPFTANDKAVTTTSSAIVTRASKVVSVKVSAQAKAPSLKVNYLTGVVSNIPKTAELTIRSGKTTTYYTDLFDASKTATSLTWVSDSSAKMTSLNIMPYLAASGTNGLTVEVRTQANATKKESLIAEVSFDPVIAAPTEGSVKFNYFNEQFAASATAKYEYNLTVTNAAVTAPASNAKFTVIKFTDTKPMNITSAISKIKAGEVGTLFIREVGTKANTKTGVVNKLPSDMLSYEIAARPTFVSDASVDFANEDIDIDSNSKNVQYSTSSAFTSYKYTNVKTVTMGALGINLNSTAYATSTFYYRIEATTPAAATATDFKGTVASLVKKFSVPKRGAAPTVSYSTATEIFTLAAAKEFTWVNNTASGDSTKWSPWTAVTTANKAFAHPSTTDAVVVYQRTPATTKAFASHIYAYTAAKVDAKITSVTGSAITELSGFTSGGSITTTPITVTTIPNATATLKYSKANAAITSGKTVTATLTVTPNTGFRFNCTDAASAKALFVTTGSKVTTVSTAVYTKPNTTSLKQGKIVFTLTITAD